MLLFLILDKIKILCIINNDFFERGGFYEK